METMPDGLPGPGRDPIPSPTLKAAALASGTVAVVVGVVLLGARLREGEERPSYGDIALLSLGTFALLYPLVLFALARMRARQDWHQRGGKPDTW